MSGTTVDDKVVTFHDTTLRDGIQSLWGVTAGAKPSIFEAVSPLLNQGNFYSTTTWPVAEFAGYVRYFGINPWKFYDTLMDYYKDTPLMSTQLGMIVKSMKPPVTPSFFRFYAYMNAKAYKGKLKYANLFSCSRDELTREFPVEFPAFRAYGVEPIPYIMYTVSPKHTDEWYANYVREVATKFKPVRICVEDVGGLMTPERARSFIPMIMKEAQGIPVELHLHGMGAYHQQVAVEAMKLGIRRFHTCVPPLANGSSMPSVFNVAMNARALGLKPQINEEPLREVERRLNIIAEQEGFLKGSPKEYEERIYQHKVPGGVIANLEYQLKGLGLHHLLDEVLDEVAQIVVDLGYPVQMTPHSQFIVTQATMNVSLGKQGHPRYYKFIDAMTEYSLGVYGVNDTGCNDLMDMNLKDKFLSNPSAKRIKAEYEIKLEEDQIDLSFDELKAKYGCAGATDEAFWNYIWGVGQDELDGVVTEPSPYNFGKEPLAVLLDALKKDHDLSRLELKKGNSFFDFRTK